MAKKERSLKEIEMNKELLEGKNSPKNHAQPINWNTLSKTAREIVKRDRDLYLEVIRG